MTTEGLVMPRKSVYIGCALTGAPTEFVQEVERLKDVVREAADVHDFVGLEWDSPAKVYEWDIEHCVRDCDLFVGIYDYPSTGLGRELGEAVHLGKGLLGLAHEKSRVTGLVLGEAAVKGALFPFHRYSNLVEDAPALIHKYLATAPGQAAHE